MFAVPLPQAQVSVYDLLAVMVATVSLPEANLVPLQAPLAVQLEATGVVDQVSTGVRLPVAEVLFAVKLMVPAVCAWARDPSTSRGSARKACVNLCIFQPITSDAGAGSFRRRRQCWDARVARPRRCSKLRRRATVAKRRIAATRRGWTHSSREKLADTPALPANPSCSGKNFPVRCKFFRSTRRW